MKSVLFKKLYGLLRSEHPVRINRMTVKISLVPVSFFRESPDCNLFQIFSSLLIGDVVKPGFTTSPIKFQCVPNQVLPCPQSILQTYAVVIGYSYINFFSYIIH